MTRLDEIQPITHLKLGLTPARTPHDRGWAFFTQNDIIKTIDPKPDGKHHWATLNIKVDERETGELEKYRVREHAQQPDDVGWKIHAKTQPVYETFEIWGNPEHAIRLDYRRTVYWRRWNAMDRNHGFRGPKHARLTDVVMYRVCELPTNVDFPEQFRREPLAVKIETFETHTIIHCHRANIGDLIEFDISELVEK